MTRNPNPHRRASWLAAAAVTAAIAVGGTTLSAPAAAGPRSEEPAPAPGDSGPAIYVVDDRVVAIRRDPVPAGEYGGHGVDYSPDLTVWTLDGGCADLR